MRLHRVDPERRTDLRRFVALPFALYRGCPQWVPPLRGEARRALDRRRQPFYRHSAAGFFLVEDGGRDVGRIAVADHRNYNRHHGSHTALFWDFECAEDPAAAALLFQAATDWAAGRGLDLMIGPKGPLLGEGVGLLVEGFEHRPPLGVAYHHPYYAGLLEGLGFEKDTDFLTGRLLRQHHLPEEFFAAADAAGAERGYRAFVFPSRAEIRRWLPRFTAAYNEAFGATWEYIPLTEEEVRCAVERLLPVMDPGLIRLVLQGDDLVGFMIAYPDISAALQRIGGRLWPFGWALLLREKHRTRWANINGMGLLPDHRGTGANAVLYAALARSVGTVRFEGADVVQVDEHGAAMVANLTAIGVPWHQRHRVYRRSI
ncbi:MAG: hypothetical protein JW785_03895 [Acidimicrobiia bacterium]|nr:hypothetical protein [Acidimicrobiia bacterium]